MICVSQGHAKGIGLEIFFKSFRCLSKSQQDKIILFLADSFNQNEFEYYQIKDVTESLIIFTDGSKLRLSPVRSGDTATMSSLISASEYCQHDNSILFTLPSSKDQFIDGITKYNGHTDFFKNRYNENATMMFYSDEIKMILMTEHVALSDVIKTINNINFKTKFDTIYQSLKNHNLFSPQRLIFSGINPHCGENGLLGSDEDLITQFIKLHGSLYQASGPYAADTLYSLIEPNDLAVFFQHDQGLSYFKSSTGFFGLNITLGLPFLRVSVDHGTAFDLYQKNQAHFASCLYGLQFCLNL
jgi:4-hydroxythreonine-4-phosphate dehydrogenase